MFYGNIELIPEVSVREIGGDGPGELTEDSFEDEYVLNGASKSLVPGASVFWLDIFVSGTTNVGLLIRESLEALQRKDGTGIDIGLWSGIDTGGQNISDLRIGESWRLFSPFIQRHCSGDVSIIRRECREKDYVIESPGSIPDPHQ